MKVIVLYLIYCFQQPQEVLLQDHWDLILVPGNSTVANLILCVCVHVCMYAACNNPANGKGKFWECKFLSKFRPFQDSVQGAASCQILISKSREKANST